MKIIKLKAKLKDVAILNLKNFLQIMPQLLPFFFVHQLSFSFILLFLLVYLFSKYILPVFTFRQVIRMYVTKLSV